MASIQQSLNNLFAASLGVGFAAVHAPAIRQHVEKKSELARLQKQQKTLEAAELQGEIPNGMLEELRAKGLSAAEKAFELDPSSKTYEQLKTQWKKQPTETPAYEGPEDYYGSEDYQQDIEQEAANRIYEEKREQDIANIINRQQTAQEAKRGVQNAVKQRRSFLEAMKNERVSFGGKGGGDQTFGQLPSQLQKQIASHYSKSERKKVMDRHYGKE